MIYSSVSSWSKLNSCDELSVIPFAHLRPQRLPQSLFFGRTYWALLYLPICLSLFHGGKYSRFSYADLICLDYHAHLSPEFGVVTKHPTFASCLFHALWTSNTYVGASNLRWYMRNTCYGHRLTSSASRKVPTTMPALCGYISRKYLSISDGDLIPLMYEHGGSAILKSTYCHG